jgi:cell division protein FtsI (penicillin-binding protein 3)
MNYASLGNSELPAELPTWRAVVLFALLLACFAGLLGRGVFLQVIDNEFLQEKGSERYSRQIEISAHRGNITDRNGKPLALSTLVESVWASPEDFKADKSQFKQLEIALGMSSAELHKHLANTKRNFVYLKRYLSPEQGKKVMSLNLPGIFLQHEYHRFYPAAEETAQILGYTGHGDKGEEGLGQEGLELALQKKLTGESGLQSVIKDRKGVFVEDAGNIRPLKPGQDVALSLDSDLQHLAYRELESAVLMNKAKAGAIVMLDARSGEVLALANFPAYNPNNRANLTTQASRNRAVIDIFEPGSTLKPFTVATALEIGKVRPDTLINTENGVLTIGSKKIHDTHAGGMMTVSQIIQKSSNVGAAKMALSMRPETLWRSLSDCGFGSLTGSEFPGEAKGLLHDYKRWSTIEQANVAFGHGLSVNLLQLARAYTVFANDGELKPVSMLKLDTPTAGIRVFSENTAHELRDMLELVVQQGGTAPHAQIAGYRVAGKTGTAHKNKGGHYINSYVASFVGFAPASNPRLIVAVMIDEPDNGKYFGGLVAAPVFSKVTEAALHALNVPNDAPLDNVVAPPAVPIKEEV